MWALLNALKQLGEFLAWNLKDLWRVAKDWLTNKWVMIVWVAGLIWEFMKWCTDLLLQGLSALGEIVMQQFDLSLPPQLLHLFSVANYIVPVQETLIYFAGYGLLIIAMTIYRHIKSYVPGPVSGGT